MAVPNTNTFTLIDVKNEIESNGGSTVTSLVSAFNNATGTFDPLYGGNKDRLGNFRNYKHEDPYITIDTVHNLTTTVATSYDINVQSNVAWTVSDDSSWVTLNKTSGSGNDTVTVTVTENTSTFERQAIIKFESTELSLPVEQTLSQTGQGYAQINLRTGNTMSQACGAPLGQFTFYTDTPNLGDATSMWGSPDKTFPAPISWYATPNQSVVRYFNGNSFTITDSCF